MKTNQKHLLGFLSLFTAAFLSMAAYLVTVDSTDSGKALFTGKEEHQITAEAAMRYVANYHSMPGEQLTAGYMGRNIFEKILAQEGTVGIRIYNARLENGSATYVILGVDKHGNDQIGGVIGEDVLFCPPYCADGALRLFPDGAAIAMK